MRNITRLTTVTLLIAVLVPGFALAQEEPRATASVWHCGTVKAYTPPDGMRDGIPFHQSEGSVTVGEKIFRIAAGTEVRHQQRPVVGEGMCLNGRLNESGHLIFYAGLGLSGQCQGGAVARYQPATASEDGVLQFAMSASPPFTADSWVFRIPAGTVLPADATDVPFRYCFVLGIDSAGRAMIVRADYTGPQRTGSAPTSQPGVGGVGRPPTGSTQIPQLPSTSTR